MTHPITEIVRNQLRFNLKTLLTKKINPFAVVRREKPHLKKKENGRCTIIEKRKQRQTTMNI